MHVQVTARAVDSTPAPKDLMALNARFRPESAGAAGSSAPAEAASVVGLEPLDVAAGSTGAGSSSTPEARAAAAAMRS